MAFQTEIEFALPNGFLDQEGALHKDGTMRLATAGDEILPLKDPRVQQNPAYLTVIVLSRVITKLGSLPDINPRIIENLFASDLSYLQALYQKINGNGNTNVSAYCPKCEHSFEVAIDGLGGGIKGYPLDPLYEEMTFIAYNLHWSYEDIMNLDHRERRRWCEEISKVNRKMNNEPKNIFDV